MQISASDLCCVRGGREVFSGLNFAVDAGAALVVTGRNGAGKSSLLRMVAGLIRQAGGSLTLAGGDAELSLGEQTHYLGHLDALKTSLTVGENLRFWSCYFGGDAAATVGLLERMGLAGLGDLPAAYLSAGQRRRLSLARLLAAARPIWLLDEPTSALDAAGQKLLADLMRAHLAKGGLIIAATHGPIGLETAKELRIGGP